MQKYKIEIVKYNDVDEDEDGVFHFAEAVEYWILLNSTEAPVMRFKTRFEAVEYCRVHDAAHASEY